jgi:hypothetical protein
MGPTYRSFSGFAKSIGNCDEKPMASGGVGEPFRRRKYQVGKAVHLLRMNLSPSIARSRLTFYLDLGRALASQEVETGGSRIIHEPHIPISLHEMRGDADLIRKGPQPMRGI